MADAAYDQWRRDTLHARESLRLMNAEQEIVKPPTDYPEYWLGQVKIVSQMEQSGTLTRSQMISEIHRIVKAMDEHGEDQKRRMEKILKAK